ncbi:hypothetical protein LMTR3_09940 [Bradyrhizobium sp. LMTR 3]|nr:hypothetical protein LMTR3_09940 [Bradyrhizobium sp. LMTR 3]
MPKVWRKSFGDGRKIVARNRIGFARNYDGFGAGWSAATTRPSFSARSNAKGLALTAWGPQAPAINKEECRRRRRTSVEDGNE